MTRYDCIECMLYMRLLHEKPLNITVCDTSRGSYIPFPPTMFCIHMTTKWKRFKWVSRM